MLAPARRVPSRVPARGVPMCVPPRRVPFRVPARGVPICVPPRRVPFRVPAREVPICVPPRGVSFPVSNPGGTALRPKSLLSHWTGCAALSSAVITKRRRGIAGPH